jgi:hypothetical protein
MIPFARPSTNTVKIESQSLWRLFLSSAFICVHLWSLLPSVAAQQGQGDVVANLAAGRVVLCVASDGIVIGAVEQRVEPGSGPPLVVPLGGSHIAILLGAVEWASPASGRPAVHLDRELPVLARQTAPPGPRLGKDLYSTAADIESVGVAFLERLRAVASELHHKLDLPQEEPLVELLLVGYAENYGPEAWLLRYRIAQEALRGDYWRTRVLRPSYTQLYPPEKGQPRTLIEVRYPDGSGSGLLDLLKQNDPRLARLSNADPRMARVAEHLVAGESHKAAAGDAAEFLRAVLDAASGTQPMQILGILYAQRGLEWVLAPPEPPQKAEEGKPREPGAPTLRKPP